MSPGRRRAEPPGASDGLAHSAYPPGRPLLRYGLLRFGWMRDAPDGEAESSESHEREGGNGAGRYVFFVSSFHQTLEPVFEATHGAAARLGLRTERVKDTRGGYRITDRIRSMIRDARIVVVDLTHQGPNVTYELGYADGLGKTIVIIARIGTEMPFDLTDWTPLEYYDSRPLEQALFERFSHELSGTGRGGS